MYKIVLLVFYVINIIFLDFRTKEMREELQTEMGELLETRGQKRQFQQRRTTNRYQITR